MIKYGLSNIENHTVVYILTGAMIIHNIQSHHICFCDKVLLLVNLIL